VNFALCNQQVSLFNEKLPNNAYTRTAGFAPPKWLFRDFYFVPFHGQVSSLQPPVTRPLGKQEERYDERGIDRSVPAKGLGYEDAHCGLRGLFG
jgi:hypothetical protein